ncbi:radical SAM protein [Candidatus Enterococcus ikei]|uniref:Radical SAM protein n=1 Tax=Candidatus Enterococcus ikei TaxID=2815326 RepID=A0ABS3H2N1_9ENTE|nr:radical SAM protein [Enterococcus sp. DIV0869a]MBO0441434.1 radical SAM protein [Enterococcus sp. DIV0869a]
MNITSASFDLTYKCNLKCKHCFNSSGDLSPCYHQQVLTHEEKEKILLDIAKLNVSSICLCGGETLLEFDFIKNVVPKIKKISPVTSINMVSNGILFDEEKARGLKEAGISLIQFSLDGFTDESYDFVRNSKGKLYKVKQAIKIAVREGFTVGVAVLPHKKNIDEIEKIIDFCEMCNIFEVRFQPFMPIGRGLENKEEITLSKDEYEYLKELIDNKEREIRKRGSNFKIEWGDPMDHFFMIQEEEDLPYLNINAYGEILVSPYLPFVVWNLRNNTLGEYLASDCLKKMLNLDVLTDTLNELTTVDSLSLRELDLPHVYKEENVYLYNLI